MVDANTTTPNTTGPAEGATTSSAGPLTAPDAAQVGALSPESRAKMAEYLSDRYPAHREQINQWYQQGPAPGATLADQLGQRGFAPAAADGSDIDTSGARDFLLHSGIEPGEVSETLAEAQKDFAAIGMPAGVTASVIEGMLRAAAADPETSQMRWQNGVRPQVERLAKNIDGSKAEWATVQKNVQAAFNKLPLESRNAILGAGDVLNDINVVMQLYLHGQRILAREAK